MCLRHLLSARTVGLVLVGLLMFCMDTAQAQISNRTRSNNDILDEEKVVSDTLGFAEKAKDNSVEIFYRDNSGKRVEYDTTIARIHRHNILGKWDIDLGNLGTAYHSLKTQAELPAEYTLLPNNMNAYRFQKTRLRFFNTTKPFTEVRYSVGSGQEQMIELFHTQNIKPYWNFNTRYRKLSSLGFYQGQKSNIDNFEFTSDYVSPKQRYKVWGSLLYNKIQQDENLGVVDEDLLGDNAFSPNIIPVVVGVASGTRSPLLNFNRDVNLSLNHSYSLGKEVSKLSADSLTIKEFKPYITFANEVYIKGERYCFQHANPDSTFVALFVGEAFNDFDDTLNVRYDNQVYGTNFSAEGNVYIKERVFSVTGGLGFEFQKIGGEVRSQSSGNNYFFGNISNKKSKDSTWKLDAGLKFYFTGMPRGNLNLSGRISKMLPNNLGEIGVNAGQYIQRPYFVSESIQVDSAEQSGNLLSQINTQLGGFYANKKLRLRASINSLLFNQLIYSNGLEPDFQQWSSAISIQQLQVRKEFIFGNWTSSNTILLQLAPDNTPIQIPLYASAHNIAYHDYLFNEKLQISTGLEVQYNSPYFYDNYQPFFQSFTPQTFFQQAMFPRLQPFFNFKIKRFRASVNVDQAQHFFIKNNQNFVRYGAQNPIIRFGLRWIFVN